MACEKGPIKPEQWTPVYVMGSCENEKPQWDWEQVCLSDDGGTTKTPGVAVRDMNDPQNPAVTLYIGGTDVTGTHDIVPCETLIDYEEVQVCRQDTSGNQYTRITWFEKDDLSVVIATIWLDESGASVTAPATTEPCEENQSEIDVIGKDCDDVDVAKVVNSVVQTVPDPDTAQKVKVCGNTGDVITDCDDNTVSQDVDMTVAIAGSTRRLPVDAKLCEAIDTETQTFKFCDGGIQKFAIIKRQDSIVDGTEVVDWAITHIIDTTGVTTGTALPIGSTIGDCVEAVQPRDVITNCALDTASTDVDKVVSIAGAETVLPVRIIENCEDTIDVEVNSGCSSVDGRRIVQIITVDEKDGSKTIALFEADGTTAVTDGSTMVTCDEADYEKVETCKTDGVDVYKLVTFINSEDTTDNFQVWIDKDGNVVPAVVGATDCATNDVIAQYETTPIEYCLDGTDQVMVYDVVRYNLNTDTEEGRITHYVTNGIDSITIPVGLLVQGTCVSIATTGGYSGRMVQGSGAVALTPTTTLTVKSYVVSVIAGTVDIVLASSDTATLSAGNTRQWDGDDLNGLSVTGTDGSAVFDIIWEEK